jgi:hypothetical protein
MGGACQPFTFRKPNNGSLTIERLSELIRRADDVNDKIGSFRDTLSIEGFLAAAFKKANREEALTNILVCETSRAHFVKFLEKEYYVNRVDDYKVSCPICSSSA